MLTYLLVFSLEASSVAFLFLNKILHFYSTVKTISAPKRLIKKQELIQMKIISFENYCKQTEV